MKTNSRLPLHVLALAALAIASIPSGQAQNSNSLTAEIPLNGKGERTYLALAEEPAQRLYCVHDGKFTIVDLSGRERVLGEIANVGQAYGLAAASRMQRAFVTTGDGDEGLVTIVDLKTSKLLQPFKTKKPPGRILFQPSNGELYVFSRDGSSMEIYEADDADFVKAVPLPEKLAAAAVDSKRIYCGGQNSITVIDCSSHKVAAQWPVAPGTGVSAVAVDEPRRRLFAACSNRQIVVMDLTGGGVSAVLPTAAVVDELAWDPMGRRMLARSGTTQTLLLESSLNKFSEQPADHPKGVLAATLGSPKRKIYVAVVDTESSAAESFGKNPGGLKILGYNPAVGSPKPQGQLTSEK